MVQAPLTETQQQLELAQILHAQSLFPDLIPPDEILECMTLQNKERIIEKVMSKQKAMQEQAQKMEELKMKELEVNNLTKVAYAHSQEGLAKERIAKIGTDQAVAQDKLRRAHQEDTASLLNVVKALKELKGMDLDHLMTQVQILNELSPAANPEKDVVANIQNVA